MPWLNPQACSEAWNWNPERSPSCVSGSNLGCSRLIQKSHPGPHVMSMVVIGATAHQVAIDHAWLIDKNPSADLEIKLALGHSGHAPAFHTSSSGRDFHTVTDAGNGLLLLEEVAGNAYQIFIVTQVFRRPASTEKMPR